MSSVNFPNGPSSKTDTSFKLPDTPTHPSARITRSGQAALSGTQPVSTPRKRIQTTQPPQKQKKQKELTNVKEDHAEMSERKLLCKEEFANIYCISFKEFSVAVSELTSTHADSVQRAHELYTELIDQQYAIYLNPTPP